MNNFYIFVSFMVGIILGWNRILSFYPLISTSLISLFFLYISYRKGKSFLFKIFLIIFFVLLGSVWVFPFSQGKPSEFLHKESQFLIKITSQAKKKFIKRTFFADIKKIENLPAYLKVKVNDFSLNNVECGDIYVVRGKLSRYKFKNNYFYTLWLKSGAYIKRIPPNYLGTFSKKLNGRIIHYFKENLSDQAWMFLSAVFLGKREAIDETTKSAFVNAGVAHIFAISGLHIGLISWALFLILKVFRIKFRARTLISIIFIIVYTFLVGMRPSVLRASIMFSVFGISFFLKRRVSLFDSLGISGLICLFLNPLWVFDLGFQLSFVSVFGIVLGFKLININLFGNNSLLTYMKSIFLSSIFVLVAIAPLSSFYFGRIYLLSAVYNLILIPFFTLILMATFVFIGFIFLSPLSVLIAEVLSFLVFFFIIITKFFGAFRFSFVSSSISIQGAVIYYLVVFFLIVALYFIRTCEKKVVMYK